MPSAPKLEQDRATGIWYARWTDPSPRGQRGRSRRASSRTTDLAEAKIWFSEWLLMEQGRPAPGQKLTVADLWSVYELKHIRVKVADGGDRHDAAWKNMQPHFGHLTTQQVTEDAVAKYCSKRRMGGIGRTSRDSTIRTELLYLIACFNWCASPKRKPPILSRVDVPHIDLPPPPAPRDRWLTTDEIGKLLKSAEELRRSERMSRGERFLWLALETASRKTALLNLDWGRVDFETGVIDYREPGRRETKKRRSVVPISATLKPVLERMYEERLKDEVNLVLDNDSSIDDFLDRIAKHAGVEGVTPHVLRHTAATHMARRGVPLWHIAKILRITLAVAEKTYAHHCPDDLRAAIDTISLRTTWAQNDVSVGPTRPTTIIQTAK